MDWFRNKTPQKASPCVLSVSGGGGLVGFRAEGGLEQTFIGGNGRAEDLHQAGRGLKFSQSPWRIAQRCLALPGMGCEDWNGLGWVWSLGAVLKLWDSEIGRASLVMGRATTEPDEGCQAVRSSPWKTIFWGRSVSAAAWGCCERLGVLARRPLAASRQFAGRFRRSAGIAKIAVCPVSEYHHGRFKDVLNDDLLFKKTIFCLKNNDLLFNKDNE